MSALTSTRRDAPKGGLPCIQLITKSNFYLAPTPKIGQLDRYSQVKAVIYRSLKQRQPPTGHAR